MKKMRVESLEHLCGIYDPKELAKLAFKIVDEQVRELRKIGIETDFLETVILNKIEYNRGES